MLAWHLLAQRSGALHAHVPDEPMSIQPVLSTSPAAEPTVQRRRTAERDAGGDREAFVLPREEPVQETVTPTRETRREMASEAGEMRREAGEARRAADEPVPASEKPSEAPAKPVAQPAAAETGGKASATEAGKPVGKAADAVPAAQPAAPNLDIAALVSIAVAAQTQSQPETAGMIGQAKGETSESQPNEGEAGVVAGAAMEAKAEGMAVVVPPAVMLAPPISVPGLPIDLAAEAAAAGAAGEGDLLSGKAGSATAAAALSLVAAREARTASAAGADASAVETSGVAPAPKSLLPGSATETMPSPVGASQVVKSDAGQDGSDTVAPTPGPLAGQAAAPSDFKPIEALQQALNPIDLSALNQQGAKPEPLRSLTMPEQIAAQAPAAAPGQGTADSQPTPLHVLPIEIGLRALAGARQFDIRLDPGELGRVDVNLSISDNGEVTAKMVVDRVETLHLLQRDARTLERAFEQAGLKPSDAGVDITLRDPSDQSGFRQGRQQDEASQRARGFAAGSEQGEDNAIPAQPAPVRRFVRLGGVDLSV
jgi:flagellar hook-length control protein FliK